MLENMIVSKESDKILIFETYDKLNLITYAFHNKLQIAQVYHNLNILKKISRRPKT